MKQGLGKQLDLTALLKAQRGAVMGLSALLILFFHCWVPTVAEFPVIGTIETVLKGYGYLSVDVFFLLSGVGMTYALRGNGSVRQFYARRLRRVYLPYVEATILSAFYKGWSPWKVLLRLTGLNLLQSGIYASLWFVQMILALYLLYPLLHRLLEKSRNDMALLGAMISGVFLITLIFGGLVPQIYRGLCYRVPTFLIGVLIGRAGQKKPLICSRAKYLTFLAAMALLFWGSERVLNATGALAAKMVYSVSFSLCFAYAAAGLCQGIHSLRHRAFAPLRLGAAVLAFCGGFTLEMYEVQVFYWCFAGPLEGRLTYLQTNLIMFVLLPAIGYVVSLLNRHILALAQRRFGRQA